MPRGQPCARRDLPQGGAAAQAPKMGKRRLSTQTCAKAGWILGVPTPNPPGDGKDTLIALCHAGLLAPMQPWCAVPPAPGCLSWMCLWSYKDVSAGGGQTPPRAGAGLARSSWSPLLSPGSACARALVPDRCCTRLSASQCSPKTGTTHACLGFGPAPKGLSLEAGNTALPVTASCFIETGLSLCWVSAHPVPVTA